MPAPRPSLRAELGRPPDRISVQGHPALYPEGGRQEGRGTSGTGGRGSCWPVTAAPVLPRTQMSVLCSCPRPRAPGLLLRKGLRKGRRSPAGPTEAAGSCSDPATGWLRGRTRDPSDRQPHVETGLALAPRWQAPGPALKCRGQNHWALSGDPILKCPQTAVDGGGGHPLSSAIATEQPIYMLCSRLARSWGEGLQQEGTPRAAWCGDAAGRLAPEVPAVRLSPSSHITVPSSQTVLGPCPPPLPSEGWAAAGNATLPSDGGEGQGKLRHSRTPEGRAAGSCAGGGTPGPGLGRGSALCPHRPGTPGTPHPDGGSLCTTNASGVLRCPRHLCVRVCVPTLRQDAEGTPNPPLPPQSPDCSQETAKTTATKAALPSPLAPGCPAGPRAPGPQGGPHGDTGGPFLRSGSSSRTTQAAVTNPVPVTATTSG